MTMNHYPSDKAYNLAALIGGNAKECIESLVRQRDELMAHLDYAHGSLHNARHLGLANIAVQQNLDEARKRVDAEAARLDKSLRQLSRVIPEPKASGNASAANQLASFVESGAARDTSIEVMQAIAALAQRESEAERIWLEPTDDERSLIAKALGSGTYRWNGQPFSAADAA